MALRQNSNLKLVSAGIHSFPINGICALRQGRQSRNHETVDMINKMAGIQGIPGKDNANAALKWRFFLLLLGMVLLWTVLCGVSHRAPDLDGMEELVWASSFELGYYKHPPFPSWVLYGLTFVFGKPVWLTFFAGQLFSALALWFVWRLGCEFTTPRRALMATLMVSTIAYFSLRGTIYNHNTAQLWSIAAATWLFYKALRYQKPAYWIWLGVVAALATMTKYSAMIQFAVFFFFMLRQGHLRQGQTLKGLVFALVAYLVVVSPHLYWLADHHFAPLMYADRSIDTTTSQGAWKDILDFVLDQFGRLSPMVVVWLALWFWTAKVARKAGGGTGQGKLGVVAPDGTVRAASTGGRSAQAGRAIAQNTPGFSFKPSAAAYAHDLSAYDRSAVDWSGAFRLDGAGVGLAGHTAGSIVGHHVLHPVRLFRAVVAVWQRAPQSAAHGHPGDRRACADGGRLCGSAWAAGLLFRALGAFHVSGRADFRANAKSVAPACAAAAPAACGFRYLAGGQYRGACRLGRTGIHRCRLFRVALVESGHGPGLRRAGGLQQNHAGGSRARTAQALRKRAVARQGKPALVVAWQPRHRNRLGGHPAGAVVRHGETLVFGEGAQIS